MLINDLSSLGGRVALAIGAGGVLAGEMGDPEIHTRINSFDTARVTGTG